MSKTGKIFAKGNHTDVYQLYPILHEEVWKMFKDGVGNFWTPLEAPMGEDKKQVELGQLTDNELLLIKRWTGLTSAGESLVANNILLVFLSQVGDPECQQYLGKQLQEELIHNWTVMDVCSSLQFTVEEVYEAYNNIPSVKALSDFMKSSTQDYNNLILDKEELLTTFEELGYKTEDTKQALDSIFPDKDTILGLQKLIKDLLVFYIFTEGILFFSSFAMILSFKQRNLLPGLCKQVEYTQRDEQLHVKFGTYLINTLRKQRPEVFTHEFENYLKGVLKTGVDKAVNFVRDALPEGIIGLQSNYLEDYVYYLANIRSEDIGIPLNYPITEHPLPWMKTIIEITPDQNFFEQRVTEYARADVLDDWDDF